MKAHYVRVVLCPLLAFASVGTVAAADNPKAVNLACNLEVRSHELPVSQNASCDWNKCDNMVITTDGVPASHSFPNYANVKEGFVNMRSVLRDIAFRFGARKPGEDGDGDPVLTEPGRTKGLDQLCAMGITQVFAANASFPKPIQHRCPDGSILTYDSVDPYDGGDEFRSKVAGAIDNCVSQLMNAASKTEVRCRVAYHCTNGEHRAGNIAALTLMNYCGFSAAEAQKYWRDREEGDDDMATFAKEWKAFKPAGKPLPPEILAEICPDKSGTLSSPAPRCE